MKLGSTVLSRLRLAPRAQAALWLAALLSLGGSLGLHPEPAGEAAGPELIVDGCVQELRQAAPARHLCVACLSHRPVSLTPVLATSSARALVCVLDATLPPARVQRPHSSNHEGRAPPAPL